MKKLGLIFILLISFSGIHAQHQISGYAGWTISKLQTYKLPTYQKSPIHDELFAFPVFNSPYVCMEYEYDWKRLRLSTGLSVISMGTSFFWGEDQPLAGMYLSIPIIAGLKFNLPKNWGLTLETGVEVGYKITNIGVYTVYDLGISGIPAKYKANVNAIIGLEANWKQFRLGVRVQVGLTDFWVWNSDATFKHSAITTYIGYTLWDSQRAKERKAKRLAEKNAKG